MPPVAVIICHHNRPGVLHPLLDSLRAQTIAADLRVFVVDNGSTDGSAAEAATCPGVAVVATGRNLGGTGGFNAGLRAARAAGEWRAVVLLDNDVTLAPDCLERLERAAAARPRAGMVTGKIYFAHDRALIQEAGALLLPGTGWLLPRFHRRWDDGTFIDTVEIDYAGACALYVTRAAWDAVGDMDEEYFLYWDDIDWCARLRATGLQVFVEPAAHIWHAGGLNLRTTTAYHYYKYRNRLRYWRKWGEAGLWPGIVKAVGEEVARISAVARLDGRTAIADTLLDALRDAADGVSGQAPAGRIRPLAAVAAAPPSWRGPVAIIDWDAEEETRYQTLFRVSELLRGNLPKASIHFTTASPPEPDMHILLKQRDIVTCLRGEVEAATIVALCEHARFDRGNSVAGALPPERVFWMDRHSNCVPGTEPVAAAVPDAALAALLARLSA